MLDVRVTDLAQSTDTEVGDFIRKKRRLGAARRDRCGHRESAEGSTDRALDEDDSRYGREYKFRGMVHALMSRGPAFLDLLGNPAIRRICKSVLGQGCIVHAYNSSSMPPGASNYSRSIHVDSPRLIPGYLTNMGITIALDPFNAETGGMEIMPLSFDFGEAPDEMAFQKGAERPLLAPGDAILFNARCWHRGGVNRGQNWRHAVTMNVCRAYMRQQFDYPRMLDQLNINGLDEDRRQFLGYHVRQPPAWRSSSCRRSSASIAPGRNETARHADSSADRRRRRRPACAGTGDAPHYWKMRSDLGLAKQLISYNRGVPLKKIEKWIDGLRDDPDQLIFTAVETRGRSRKRSAS